MLMRIFLKIPVCIVLPVMLFSNFVRPSDISIGNDYFKTIDIQMELSYI
jgi:hypothetical protein